MIQGEILLVQVWVVNPSMVRASKTNFQKNCTIFVEPFRWQMLDQTQMVANSLLYKINISHIRKKKELVRGGWPEEIAEIYTTEGGTPHLDQRHTVFGQLMDEASFCCVG